MNVKHCRMILSVLLTILLLAVLSAAYAEEKSQEQAEQGLEEIQTLVEMSEVDGTEGMSLEELTEAFTETAMSDYYDNATGFSMQYPAIFQFSEEAGTAAKTADGRATLSIENLSNDGNLTESILLEAIKLELPDAEPQRNEKNGCLRTDRITDEGLICQTDLYLVTEKSFHHVVIRYPAEEQEQYAPYIEYMINTLAASSTEQG